LFISEVHIYSNGYITAMEKLSSLPIIVMGTKIEPQDLFFLENTDLPRCGPCFRRRHKCDGRRPCQSCRTQYGSCRDVTLKSLKEFPDFARYFLTGKRGTKPKNVKLLVIDRPSFHKCHVCFLRRNKCDGGRPCHRASSTGPCETCIRYCRPCSNNLEELKKN
jgi:hypothetical protein